MVRPCIEYKGLIAQQHPDISRVFIDFLRDIKPSRVLEIGTAGGGFILFIREALDFLGLSDTTIKSFDIVNQPHYDSLRKNRIEINIMNLFDSSYSFLSSMDTIKPYIQKDGTTLVLCDGGNKITEFNAIAPLIKKGDFIMTHDYIDTKENFEKYFYGKIWDWCEIEEKDISLICEQEHLKAYNQDAFMKVVWACRRKMA